MHFLIPRKGFCLGFRGRLIVPALLGHFISFFRLIKVDGDTFNLRATHLVSFYYAFMHKKARLSCCFYVLFTMYYVTKYDI